VLLGAIADDVTVVEELLRLFSILPAVHTQNILVPDIFVDTGRLTAANVLNVALIFQSVDLLLDFGIGEIAQSAWMIATHATCDALVALHNKLNKSISIKQKLRDLSYLDFLLLGLSGHHFPRVTC
jgi:hypothetical protein